MEQRSLRTGITVRYRDVGAGPAIVLLHGGLMDAASAWSAHLPALAAGHRVLAPDARGHGRSDNPTGELTYELLADDAAAFITELALDRPLVVGFSDGGIAALQLAIRHPGVAGALVLGGIVVRYDDAYDRFLRELGKTDGGIDEAVLAAAAPGFHGYVRGLHGKRWPTLLAETGGLWSDVPAVTDAQLAAIDVPAVVLTGDRDTPSMGQSPRVAAALPHGELAVLPGLDHGGSATSPLFATIILDAAARFRTSAPPAG